MFLFIVVCLAVFTFYLEGSGLASDAGIALVRCISGFIWIDVLCFGALEFDGCIDVLLSHVMQYIPSTWETWISVFFI